MVERLPRFSVFVNFITTLDLTILVNNGQSRVLYSRVIFELTSCLVLVIYFNLNANLWHL